MSQIVFTYILYLMRHFTSEAWSFLSKNVSQCSWISSIPNLRASVRRGLETAFGLIHTCGGSPCVESSSATTRSRDPRSAAPCELVTAMLPDKYWHASCVKDTVLLLTSCNKIQESLSQLCFQINTDMLLVSDTPSCCSHPATKYKRACQSYASR